MSRRWFGTDGIRGEAGTGPLSRPFLVRLGRALGEQTVAEAGAVPDVLLARDTRASGAEITGWLATGLAAAGARPIDLGVLPTAGLPMAMRARGAARGVVVSASHNPWRDNGVKVFGPGGHKLTDEQEAALEDRIEALGGETGGGEAGSVAEGTRTADTGETADGPGDTADGERAGPAGRAPVVEDGAAAYEAALLERFAGLDLSSLRLAIDCAHGAAHETAPAVLTALGASVTAFFASPDGRNINDRCGSTHLSVLSDAVASGDHDLGLAFDGDADRVLAVDARGRPCTGDHMMGFLGAWLADHDALPGRTVVATVMSNLGLERMLAGRRIRLLRTQVGDRYVKQAMREGGYALGGEDSGHLLFGTEHDNTGDGLYTALRLLQGLLDTGRTLAEVVDAVPRVPQVLLNVRVPSRPPLDELPALTGRARRIETELGDAIRIVLRYSGTEALARVMVEGLDGERVRTVADELAELWQAEIAGRPSASA